MKIERGSESLPVMESFYSIQGEGYHSGKPAYFIRLAGCDVKCKWCDVKDSWSISPDQYLDVNKIVNKIDQVSAEIIVITGGEPLHHNLDNLTSALKKIGKKIHLETSGTEPLTGEFDWICLSPKKNKKPLDDYFKIADELKMVIYRINDFRWAERNASKINEKAKLILQPEWSMEKKMNPEIIKFIKLNPKWRISLQTHKYLKVE